MPIANDKRRRPERTEAIPTDIQLEPGETITDVASGDSERWLVTPASSGDPRNPTPHLAIKPTAAGISTNLTIYTTKHIYHLMLRSRAGREIQEVAFYYPEDLEQAMQDADHTAAKARDSQSQSDGAVASLASLDPGALNFSYAVSGPKLPWKPVRAFDDGTHIYIQMPRDYKVERSSGALGRRRRRQRDGELSRQGRLLRGRQTLRPGGAGFGRRSRAGPRQHPVHRRGEVNHGHRNGNWTDRPARSPTARRRRTTDSHSGYRRRRGNRNSNVRDDRCAAFGLAGFQPDSSKRRCINRDIQRGTRRDRGTRSEGQKSEAA
jgi:P-type conjugative transfer protein TrbG